MEQIPIIDLHSHILPQLDDGAQSLHEALHMVRIAVDSGVTEMAATPHCADDRLDEIRGAYELLQEALYETGIPLKLYPGMEIFGTRRAVRLLDAGKLLTLNGSRYPLVEFDFLSSGEEETAVLREMVRGGYVPVIAHPERYVYLQQEPAYANEWAELGCLFQINRGSLLGRFGNRERELAFALVDRGFATVIASDAHAEHRRTPWMADIRQLLSREFSEDRAAELLLHNPDRILHNKQLSPAEPDWF